MFTCVHYSSIGYVQRFIRRLFFLIFQGLFLSRKKISEVGYAFFLGKLRWLFLDELRIQEKMLRDSKFRATKVFIRCGLKA